MKTMIERKWITPTPRGDSRRDKANLFLKQDGKCHTCGCRLEVKGYILEHVIPLADGGSDDIANKVANCNPCAKAKTALESSQRAEDRRVRDKHIGAFKAKKSMPFGRNSPLKKKMDGTVVRRDE